MAQKITPIIGVEVHVELSTETKMFCRCKNDPFQSQPNTLVCPTCLGLPGALPVPNEKAIELVRILGLALRCHLNEFSYFERKNYFYPDLPKGYQISQLKAPFCERGEVIINGKNIRINRVHLEEDAGKLKHTEMPDKSIIDFNRSGVPLAEIVTEPDFTSPEEVISYLKELQRIIRTVGVSNADMEKGSMRLEPTVNLKIENDNEVYYSSLVEIKNINSFKFVKKALEFEIEKQINEYSENKSVIKTRSKITAGFNEQKGITVPLRSKEEANDYRYFPEPDIPPFLLSAQKAETLRSKVPELPEEKRSRLVEKHHLSREQADILIDSPDRFSYFEELLLKNVDPIKAAKLLINKPEYLNKPLKETVGILLDGRTDLIDDETILSSVVSQVISSNPKVVDSYRLGKLETLSFLIGQVMKKTQGKANQLKTRELLEKELKR